MNSENFSDTRNLTERVVTGTGWVLGDKITQRALRIITLIFIARFLGPEDFGLYGIAILTIETTEIFTRIGIDTALVRKPGAVQHYLNTAWTIQLIRALLLAICLWVFAPTIAEFFEEARAASLISVLAISVILRGVMNNAVLYFLKDLQFHKNFIFDVCPAFVSFTVGITLAYLLRNLWALVAANIAEAATKCVLSYVLHFRFLRLNFDLKQANELFGFGLWLLGSSLMTFLSRRTPDFIIGKVLGATTLGLFAMASRITTLIPDQIEFVANTLGMPTYAKVQKEKRKLGQALLTGLEVTMLLAFPITVFVIITAPDIVSVVLGSKWKDAVLPIRILSCCVFFFSVRAVYQPIFVACGVPRYLFLENGLWALIVGITIYPFTHFWGFTEACISCLIGAGSSILLLPVAVSISEVLWSEIGKVLLRATLLAAVVTVGLLSIVIIPIVEETLPRFILEIFVSSALYLLVIRSLRTFYDYSTVNRIMREKWGNLFEKRKVSFNINRIQ